MYFMFRILFICFHIFNSSYIFTILSVYSLLKFFGYWTINKYYYYYYYSLQTRYHTDNRSGCTADAQIALNFDTAHVQTSSQLHESWRPSSEESTEQILQIVRYCSWLLRTLRWVLVAWCNTWWHVCVLDLSAVSLPVRLCVSGREDRAAHRWMQTGRHR